MLGIGVFVVGACFAGCLRTELALDFRARKSSVLSFSVNSRLMLLQGFDGGKAEVTLVAMLPPKDNLVLEQKIKKLSKYLSINLL